MLLGVLGLAYFNLLGAYLVPTRCLPGARSMIFEGRSWAALGASVGALGRLSGLLWVVLGSVGAPVGGLRKGSSRKVAELIRSCSRGVGSSFTG